MVEKLGTRLEGLSQVRPAVVEALRPLWITTVEELVTTACDERGRQGLARLLHIQPSEVDELAQALWPLVPSDIQDQIGLEPRAYARGAWDEFDADRPRDLLGGLDVPQELPDRVSLQERLPPIRQQGMRGTCVAHACTALREYLTEDPEVNLSEQFLYWAARQHLLTPVLKHRPGSLLLYGMMALEEMGVCPEDNWPYHPDPVPGSEDQGPPPPEALERASAYRIQRYVFLWPRDIRQLKAHLAGGYLIAFTVPTFGYWSAIMIGRTGVIRMPLTTEGTRNPMTWLTSAHALCLVGYQDDDTVPGGGYFMVRNSWGIGWARQCADGPGYGWMPYAYMQRYGLTAFTAI